MKNIETKTTRTAEEITADIIKYFENNEDIYNETIEALDGYNGYLCDDRILEMCFLSDYLGDMGPLEILNMSFFGHDADTWTENARGEKVYGSFNPNREYFYFNGYGNLVSTDYKDYSDHLDKYFVKALKENRGEIYLDCEEVENLLDELDEVEA